MAFVIAMGMVMDGREQGRKILHCWSLLEFLVGMGIGIFWVFLRLID